MTLEQRIERNDLLRMRFTGGIILVSPAVFDLPAWFRGRVLYHLAQPQRVTNEDHSEGIFAFGGSIFYWSIGEFAGEFSLSLSLGGE